MRYKRLLILVLMVALFIQVVPANAAQINQQIQQQITGQVNQPFQSNRIEQKQILEKWQRKSKNTSQNSVDFQVHWNKKKSIPNFVQGLNSDKKIKSSQQAIDFVKNNEALFNINSGKYKLNKSFKDKYNMTHYKIIQEIDGIPLYGKELVVHTDKNNEVYALNGALQPDIGIDTVKWSKYITLSDEECIAKAKEFLNIDSIDSKLISKPQTQHYLYEFKDNWYLVNLVTLQFNEPYPANYKIFVDLTCGSIVDSYNAVANGSVTCSGTNSFGDTVSLNGYEQNSYYYLYDTTHGAVIETYTLNNILNATQPGARVKNTTGNFNAMNERVAVDAHSNLAKVYDFYYNTFGRKGFDNRNSNIKSSVHYYDNKSGKNNAFWNGRQMLFGDGDGESFGSFGSALDVVAHEFTHAVTQYTANLEYRNQSGAINESISDVFGVLCQGPVDKWWLVGEDCYTPGKYGDALRDMKNPENVDQPQPGHMNSYKNVSYDNGGVHINSGIPNRAFYLIANSLGFNKTGKIYYRALTSYLTSTSDFMDLRNSILQSASDIYGATSTEYNTAKDAFSKVGLGSSSSSDTYEPNDTASDAYGPLVSGKTYESYISSESDNDVYKFKTTDYSTIRISLTNLAGDYDLYLFNGNGTLVAKSENNNTTSESITYNGSSDTYYIKIVGYNGAYSTTKPYRLTVTY
ncbi:M4 family metallopeptidase [Clostridiaceae bacterium M8S5]|nr:M4 family metallopeptidase [Clostridiaceae bacterium M8S5]